MAIEIKEKRTDEELSDLLREKAQELNELLVIAEENGLEVEVSVHTKHRRAFIGTYLYEVELRISKIL